MAPALLRRGEPCPQPQPVSCLHNHHQHGSHSSIPVPLAQPRQGLHTSPRQGAALPAALLSGLASPLCILQEPEHFSTSQPQFAAPQPSSSSVFTESHPVGVPLPSLSLLPPAIPRLTGRKLTIILKVGTSSLVSHCLLDFLFLIEIRLTYSIILVSGVHSGRWFPSSLRTTGRETLNLKLPSPLDPAILLLKIYLTGKTQVRSIRMLAVVLFVMEKKPEMIHSMITE